MILAELARRGRGDRVLIVCPRHVLEQMQRELWTRFALPFVRLDSVGVQRVKQVLPATRNPFTYFKRVIISIDTLKQGRFAQRPASAPLGRGGHRRVAQRHELRRPRTTGWPGSWPPTPRPSSSPRPPRTTVAAESFAELVRLLEPTAVNPGGELIADEVKRLVVRRHRHSAEVAEVVGVRLGGAPRATALPGRAVAGRGRGRPRAGRGVAAPRQRLGALLSGDGQRLFPWTLAKAFLSSPAALQQTIKERLRASASAPDGTAPPTDAPRQYGRSRPSNACVTLNQPCVDGYRRQVRPAARPTCARSGWGRQSDERVVIFAERVATLGWLAKRLRKDLRLPTEAVAVLHGGLDDDTQQEVVESFKQATLADPAAGHRRRRLGGREPAHPVP